MTTPALAPRKSNIRMHLLAFLGLPVLALLSFFWLEIPDSHIWELALSLITASLLLGTFLWIVSSTVRSTRRSAQPCSLWVGAALLGLWLVVEWTLLHLVSHINDHAMERVGFWNSKLSAGMRTTLTFDRLIAWQHDVLVLLLWIVVPAILTPFFIETVSRGLGASVWRSAAAVLRSWQHWLTFIFSGVAVYWVTDKLTGWHPSRSVHGELISLVLRLAFCYLIVFALAVLVLRIDAMLLAREHARRYPAAEPTANSV